ncbi:MAG: tRNA (adenosine(37)-N6)-threonylcarbamoyltransferase complex ATPase subunit type 1 TsaE [Microcoleaceae cyanobacterium]
MKLQLVNAEATQNLGTQLGRCLPPGSTILLVGNLGSGKTTLVQGIAQGLGIQETIDSPTFTLINEYLTGRIPLYHFDCYRLQSEEIEGLNPELYWEGIEVKPGIVAIEWAERLSYKPEHYIQINLGYTETNERLAEIMTVGVEFPVRFSE